MEEKLQKIMKEVLDEGDFEMCVKCKKCGNLLSIDDDNDDDGGLASNHKVNKLKTIESIVNEISKKKRFK